MSNINGTTRTQTLFLRSFRNSPSGPGLADWPSPAVLRRWMRKPGFIKAMRSLKTALIYQSDFQLLSAAASAAQGLHAAATVGDDDAAHIKQVQLLASLLKLAHLRLRFQPPEPSLEPKFDIDKELQSLELINPNLTMGEATRLLREMSESRAEHAAEQDALLR